MASRKEEKERLRNERLAHEEADKAVAAKRRRLRIIAGGVAGAIGLAVVVFVVVSGDGSSGGKLGTAAIPATKTTALAPAARLAGCQLNDYTDYGNEHTSKSVKYTTNPPTSGAHDSAAAPDGAYAAGKTVPLGQSVHSLEHGRIDIQWKPGLPQNEIDQLHTLFETQQNGYHLLLFQNQTKMPYAVAATAWQHSLTCAKFNDKLFDAIRAFTTTYVDQGPEQVP